MNVTFDVPNTVAQELNSIAIKAGFPNAKAMTIAYWKATIQSAREQAARATIPVVKTDDVVIS